MAVNHSVVLSTFVLALRTNVIGEYNTYSVGIVVSSHPRKCKWCALCSGSSRRHSVCLLLKHFEDYERCEKFPPNVDMMGGGMVFGPVIGIVGFARAPVKPKLIVASRSRNQ